MRGLRIKGDGECYYHCLSRVVDRRFILGKREKEQFCKMMRAVERFCGVKVVTYAVMSNHFHILVGTPESLVNKGHEACGLINKGQAISCCEAMAYAVQSPTLTVGADGRTAGSISDSVSMEAFGFGDVHSATFLFPLQKTREFYDTLLIKFQITPLP